MLEKTDPEIQVEFVCPMCGKEHYLTVKESIYNRCIHRRETGEYIQDILKEYDASVREKFITGYCDECQKEIFGGF